MIDAMHLLDDFEIIRIEQLTFVCILLDSTAQTAVDVDV